MKEITEIAFIKFIKIGRFWNAQIFTDIDTCVSWQKVGSLRNVKHIIKTQLDPLFIQALIVKS